MTEYRLHGPPGCGKSHALATNWIPRAAERFGSDKVAVCSLTKTAAEEIGSRGLPISQDNVGTLHALAYRSLGKPDIAEGHLDEWNEFAPMFRLSKGTASVENPEATRATVGDGLMSLYQIHRHRGGSQAIERADLRAFAKKYRAFLQGTGYTDFTGLIEDALAGVDTAPGLPEVFVVDEAQDCSALELALVRKWAQAASYTVLAGDGDQAIYGWRGASARAFLGTPIPDDHNFHLTQSYRVPRAVHREAAAWIDRASFRYAVEYLPRDDAGSVTTIRGSAKNIRPIIDAMCEEADKGKSVMLLGACGYMLRAALAQLRADGIPFHNPFRPSNLAWNPMRGAGQKIQAFLRPDPECYDDARMWSWKEALTWVEIVKAKHLNPAGKTMIRAQATHLETMYELVGEGDGRACFGPAWDELLDCFKQGTALDWLRPRILTSKAKLAEFAFKIAEKRGKAALLRDPLITVGTIHSVKGGQADVVFLLPDLSASGMREWTRPGEGRDGIIRTFYVGMTRAKEKLVACQRSSPRAIDWMPR